MRRYPRRTRLAIALAGLGTTGLLGCLNPPIQAEIPAPQPGTRTAAPVGLAGRPLTAEAGPRLVVQADQVLHAASPFVTSFNRNHNHRQFERHQADRQAMIEATRALAPRWGTSYLEGLAQSGYPASSARPYLYRTGHGPTDGRHDYRHMAGYRFQESWTEDGQEGTWDGYPYDDMRYPLKEAADMGAETLVTVNFGTDSAESAGALARYLNGPAEVLRALRPLTEPPFSLQSNAPLGVFMFEIGNEIQLPFVIGHEKARSIPEYVANAAPYVRQIRQAQPHPVKIALNAAVNIYWGGPNQKGDAWEQQAGMITAFIREAERQQIAFEALQYHGYPLYPVQEGLAGNAYVEKLFTDKLLPALAKSPRPIEIWNDEFHAASKVPGRNPGLYGALFAADTVATALRLSLGGRQVMTVCTDFAWWHAGESNHYDSLYFQNDDARATTPIYHFRRLLAGNFGDFVVGSRLEGVGAWTDVGVNGEVTTVSNLNAAVARSKDGASLHLIVVNRARDADETLRLDVSGFVPREGLALMHRIESDGSTPVAWDAPWDRVRVTEGQVVDPAGPLSFPRSSITFLEIR